MMPILRNKYNLNHSQYFAKLSVSYCLYFCDYTAIILVEVNNLSSFSRWGHLQLQLDDM